MGEEEWSPPVFPIARGRFVEHNPMATGVSLYVFVSNTPVNTVDRIGLAPASALKRVTVVTRPATYAGPFPQPESSNPLGSGFEAASRAEIDKFAGGKGWIVLDVSTVSDAGERLKDPSTIDKCSCIETLHITGHGEPGKQYVGSTMDPQNARAIVSINNRGTFVQFGLDEMFAGVSWCRPCTIYLRGCNVGKGDVGEHLVQAVSKLTGCSVSAFTREPTYAGAEPGLPSYRKWPGFDVTYSAGQSKLIRRYYRDM